MKILKLLICLAFLLAGCATTTPLEALVTTADASYWKVGYQKDFGPGEGYIREFVPEDESIENWSELLSIEFLEGEKRTAKEWIMNFAERRKAQCPGTEFELLESDTFNAFYTFHFPDCMEHSAQTEISRAVQGNDGLHRLSYAIKGRDLTQTETVKWLNFLREAYVAKGSPDSRVR